MRGDSLRRTPEGGSMTLRTWFIHKLWLVALVLRNERVAKTPKVERIKTKRAA